MADTQIKITADVKQAERAIQGLEKSLANLQDSSADVAKALGAITAAAAAMGFAILKTLDSAGQLVDAADSLGVSAESLYKLHNAALLAGVGSDQLNASLQRLSANLGEGLQKGAGPAVDAMKRLGLPIQDIVNLRPDEQFKKITDKLLEIENPAQRAAASIDLFGKQGPAILRVAENMAKVAELKDRLGLGISQKDIVALDQAGEALDELKIIWESGLKKAVVELTPYIIAVVEKIKEAIEASGGIEGVWQKIKSVLNIALNIMVGIATVLAIRMVAGAAAFAVQLGRALVAARGISLVLSRTPIGLISAGIAVAAEALGVDLVGAGKEFLDVNLDIEGAQGRINTAYDESTKKLNATTTAAVGLNDIQKKALDTLEEQVLKTQAAAQYQQDLIDLGETEAKIRQKITEETDKLKKANVDVNSAQAQALLTALEGNLRLEESLKRQIALRQEQSQAVFNAILGEQSAFEQALQKQLEFRLLMEGKTAEEIKKIREQEVRDNPTLGAMAEEAMNRNVQRAIDAEIGKANKLYEIQKRHSKEFQDLLNIELTAQLNNYKLSEEQYAALEVAKTELMKAQQLERLEFDKQMAERRVQVELDRINRVMKAEKDLGSFALSEGDKQILQKVGQEERQKAIIDERIRFEKKSEQEKFAFAIDQGAQMFSALGAQNKRAFEAAKAFNIANAIMNTYMAATKALATYPPPFNFIAAAAAVGMGLAQVAQIRSQSYSGRQLGGPVMGNQTYMVGENGPELFTPATTGRITRNSDVPQGNNVNVNFTIVANDTTGFDQLLASRKGVIQQIISDAMLEKGRRSMV